MTARNAGLGLVTPILLAGAALSIGGCTSDRVVDVYEDSLDAAGITTLDIALEDGDLAVTGDASATEIAVTVELVTNRTSDDKDGDARHELRFELRDMGDGTALLNIEDPPTARYFANVAITMPDAVALIVDDGGGDQVIDGCGGYDGTDKDGDVEASHITGDVWVEDRDGDLSLKTIIGTVIIDDGAGDMWVEDVDGDVDISDAGGHIEVTSVTGTVTIDDGAGDITVTDAGTVEIVNAGGGSLTIK